MLANWHHPTAVVGLLSLGADAPNCEVGDSVGSLASCYQQLPHQAVPDFGLGVDFPDFFWGFLREVTEHGSDLFVLQDVFQNLLQPVWVEFQNCPILLGISGIISCLPLGVFHQKLVLSIVVVFVVFGIPLPVFLLSTGKCWIGAVPRVEDLDCEVNQVLVDLDGHVAVTNRLALIEVGSQRGKHSVVVQRFKQLVHDEVFDSTFPEFRQACGLPDILADHVLGQLVLQVGLEPGQELFAPRLTAFGDLPLGCHNLLRANLLVFPDILVLLLAILTRLCRSADVERVDCCSRHLML